MSNPPRSGSGTGSASKVLVTTISSGVWAEAAVMTTDAGFTTGAVHEPPSGSAGVVSVTVQVAPTTAAMGSMVSPAVSVHSPDPAGAPPRLHDHAPAKSTVGAPSPSTTLRIVKAPCASALVT